MPFKECLILAAGMSTRMGNWKMMLPWGEGTVLDSAMTDALSFCDRIILVTGFRGAELHQRYHSNPDIILVHNDRYQEGMFSSVQAGVKHIKGEHFFLALGDMPVPGSAVYPALWQQRSAECLIPVFEHGKGHPVLLPSTIVNKILNARPDDNLKTIINRYGSRTLSLQENGILWDVDTPQQYLQLLSRYKSLPERA